MVELKQSPPDRFVVSSPDAMRTLGGELGGVARSGDVYLLHGDLGAGKTTLTQGFAEALRISEPILSPTFNLIVAHEGVFADGSPCMLYHLDLYRLENQEELESLGYDRYLAPDGVSVIEWPERAGSWLPSRFRLVRIVDPGNGARQVEISSVGVRDR